MENRINGTHFGFPRESNSRKATLSYSKLHCSLPSFRVVVDHSVSKICTMLIGSRRTVEEQRRENGHAQEKK